MRIYLSTWPVPDQKRALDWVKRERDNRLLSYYFVAVDKKNSNKSGLYFNENLPRNRPDCG